MLLLAFEPRFARRGYHCGPHRWNGPRQLGQQEFPVAYPYLG